MENATVTSTPVIACGVATRPLAGQAVCGDLHVIKSFTGGVLMAALDGIGHGGEAAASASAAVAILENHAEESPVLLVRRCHVALKTSRGVVMTIAALNPTAGALAWLGVGNVAAVLLRAEATTRPTSEHVVLRSGLVGYALPELRISTTHLTPGDLLVFATNGVYAGFHQGWVRSDPPQRIADRIMERYFKGTDDALVLVARYLGVRRE